MSPSTQSLTPSDEGHVSDPSLGGSGYRAGGFGRHGRDNHVVERMPTIILPPMGNTYDDTRVANADMGNPMASSSSNGGDLRGVELPVDTPPAPLLKRRRLKKDQQKSG